MTSEKQVAANNLNALKGGVKTDLGKSRSRTNARKHGVLSNAIQEDEVDIYKCFLEALQEEFSPESYMEDGLVEAIAHYRLKLYKLHKAESEYVSADIDPSSMAVFLSRTASENAANHEYEPLTSPSTVEKLSNVYQRYATTLENRMYRALRELRLLKK